MHTLSNTILKSTLVLCTSVLFSCQSDINEVLETALQENPPIHISYNSTTYYSSYGLVTTELKAPVIEQYDNADTSFTLMPKGFTAIFLDSLQQEDSRLTAEYGTYLPSISKMIAKENVVVTNKKGEALHTEELIWLQDSGIIVTDEFVKIVREDGVIYGKGLRAEEDFSAYEIQQITGEIEYNEES